MFPRILCERSRVGGDAEQRQFTRRDGAGEDTVQSVIVSRGNRIVLVIVAPRTTDRQRHRAARHDIDSVVDRIVVVHELPTDRQKPKSSEWLFVLTKVEVN